MNIFIDAQCKHIAAMVNAFVHACEIATKKDDQAVSKEEEKTLKQIRKAAERFKKDLAKCNK